MAKLSRQEVAVAVVDDDAMVREWVRLALEGSEFRLAGTASSTAEAVELVERRRPDLLLFDYRLSDGLGTELLRELRLRGVGSAAVMMTANAEEGFNETAREAGAQGTVLKSGSSNDLLRTLREVRAGRTAFDGRYPSRSRRRVALSPREREVLALVASGETNRGIAARLGIGDETVKTLLSRACSKLGVSRRAEAVAAAYEAGLL